jgi:hypothetical protein
VGDWSRGIDAEPDGRTPTAADCVDLDRLYLQRKLVSSYGLARRNSISARSFRGEYARLRKRHRRRDLLVLLHLRIVRTCREAAS